MDDVPKTRKLKTKCKKRLEKLQLQRYVVLLACLFSKPVLEVKTHNKSSKH